MKLETKKQFQGLVKSWVKECINDMDSKQPMKEIHIDPDTISDEDVLDTTAPKFTQSPEETAMHALTSAKRMRREFAGKEPEEIAVLLGVDANDPKILSLIKALMTSLFYA